MAHKKIVIRNEQGVDVEAVAPVIVSASRATDIPAFYADWFFNRLDKGYLAWRNPFNGKDSYVSFANTRFVVFWSKNPKPLIPYLPILQEKGIGFYIQFTLNDYDAEQLEPGVSRLAERIDTFKRIVDEYGLGSVVWRFDPLILTDKISPELLLHRISAIAELLNGFTEKLVFSFADIADYRSVARNLRAMRVNYREWNMEEMLTFARRLADMRLPFRLATCAEAIDLEDFGIEHNRCIDPELISRRSPDDAELQTFLQRAKPDSGQRKLCGCILSKDIGAYNTCPHLCRYCYANYSPQTVMNNFRKHTNSSESII
ncbi:MAG: DUF1848 domain-containing protein [Bacteroidales bacterium]|nr:DUF1848 domain-containing protein [Bacteroidales bacterium]